MVITLITPLFYAILAYKRCCRTALLSNGGVGVGPVFPIGTESYSDFPRGTQPVSGFLGQIPYIPHH